LPLLAFIAKRALQTSFTIVGLGLVYFSGSRAANIAAAVFLVISLFKNKRWFLLIPIASMGLSVFEFLSATGSDLTGRGYIYSVLRSGFFASPFLGSGPRTLENAYNNRDLSFFVNHQHGQAPYIFSDFGLLVFVVIAAVVIRRCYTLFKLNDLTTTNLAMPFVIGSTMMATETMFTLTIDSQVVWAIILFVVPLNASRVSHEPIELGGVR
jgi:hypothetical protein